MLALSTVVICFLCISDTLPFGNNMKTVQCLLFLKASIAALPVSPEVAPNIVIDLFFLLKEVSKN